MTLPLIKHNVVETIIEHLLDNPPSTDESLIKFQHYFRKQWLDNVPIKYWNFGPIHLRCNNSLEGADFGSKMLYI